MRDPERIQMILFSLNAVWEMEPDLRFGQLIENVIGSADKLFYIEDDDLLRAIKEFEDNR